MSRTPPPMLAKAAEPVAGRTPSRSPQAPSQLLPAEARPEDVLERLHELIENDQIGTARQLVAEAAHRFPQHGRIRLAKRILNDGKAIPDPYVQPTVAAESDWLDNPPQEARGKWVALIGSELVGMADSVEGLMKSLASKNLELIPLVHHVAP